MFASVLQVAGLVGVGVFLGLVAGVLAGVVGGVAVSALYVGLALERRGET